MENFAYHVRKTARENQSRYSTSIRLDDITQSLVLAAREEGEDEWRMFTKEDLKTCDSSLSKLDLDDTITVGGTPTTSNA